MVSHIHVMELEAFWYMLTCKQCGGVLCCLKECCFLFFPEILQKGQVGKKERGGL